MSVKILNENLKTNNFSSLYYILGEEEYLKNHYFSQLKSKVVTEFSEFNLLEFDSKNFIFLDFCNAVNSYPVMSDRKIVTVVDFDNSLLKKDFTKEFVSFLKNIPDYCVVVFLDTALKSLTSTNSLEKAISSAGGIVVDVKSPDIISLTNWAIRHFKSYNKNISKEDIHYLIDLTDSDMLSLSNEISKLCNFVTSDMVLRSDIDKVVTKSIDTNRYEIAEAFCNRNYSKIFDIVDKLYKQCIDDFIISNVFYRAFSDMWKAKLASQSGKNSTNLSSDFKMHPYAANKIIKNSKSLSIAFLHKALDLSLELDLNLKSTPFNKKDLLITYIGKLIELRNNDGKASH